MTRRLGVGCMVAVLLTPPVLVILGLLANGDRLVLP